MQLSSLRLCMFVCWKRLSGICHPLHWRSVGRAGGRSIGPLSGSSQYDRFSVSASLSQSQDMWTDGWMDGWGGAAGPSVEAQQFNRRQLWPQPVAINRASVRHIGPYRPRHQSKCPQFIRYLNFCEHKTTCRCLSLIVTDNNVVLHSICDWINLSLRTWVERAWARHDDAITSWSGDINT